MEPTLFLQTSATSSLAPPPSSSIHPALSDRPDAQLAERHQRSPDATFSRSTSALTGPNGYSNDDSVPKSAAAYSPHTPLNSSRAYYSDASVYPKSEAHPDSLPALSEQSLGHSSPAGAHSSLSATPKQLDDNLFERKRGDAVASKPYHFSQNQVAYKFDSMSNGYNSPAQPGFKEEIANPWDRRDSLPVSASTSQFAYDDQTSGGDRSARGGAQYASGFTARESFSGSSSLSPTTHSSSRPPSQMPPPLQDSYMLHRASISGPVMGSTPAYSGEGGEAGFATHAPPRAHGLAAWETASGAARPHTADGMFGQFGFPEPYSINEPTSSAAASSSGTGPASASLASGSMSAPRGFASGPNSAAGIDAYAQQRRFSMPNTAGMAGNGDMAGNGGGGPGGNKVFSYMPPMDDLAGHAYGPNGYHGHMLGGMGGFGNNVGKKRPRRRYDEIERLYPCKWPGCTKSYGTLNHLNAHVAMQKHGPKRSPSEFKDMRKAWRRQKKEEEQRRQARHHAGYAAPLSMAAPSSRYSMSSVSSSSTAGSLPPYGYSSAPHSASSANHLGALPGSSSPGFDAAAHPSASSLGGGADARPYTAGASNQSGTTSYPSGGLGAYLMAHRGSI
ncbi:uncharacterized protein PFL1_03863 [Pseudozyma flocculosa PF-1]|uniref:C2H2-type domain-containing protein n=1 Tax=Pseudozyma flocculosa PF-1 TaxID=1277687 RepID=A0A061H7Z7_9BASI|nr:uncharacterized protein PFL1_03863 [Pseudozyma flocculosa PF-1]EPQ28559.1 hypothetical protein PFL1_03863 [Pseudozyma flocculosa PF-1]